MPYSIPEREALVEAYILTGSIQETRNLFGEKFPDRPVPAKSSIQDLVWKWRATGSVGNKRKYRKPTVRTPQLMAEINEIMKSSPEKSTRKLAKQVNVSRRTCARALKALKSKPYRVTVVQQLGESDNRQRAVFCRWLLDMVAGGHMDPLMFFMSDEAWFHLSGYVECQNSRYWWTENPHELPQQSLQGQKIGVWCGVSASRIVGPIFTDSTDDADVYLAILEEFYSQLTEHERGRCFFQQEGSTCHTSERSLARIHDMFTAERTVSLWPRRSPDLSVCGFYLWEYLKGTVYDQIPQSIEELKDSIKNSIGGINTAELTQVYMNLLRRARSCLDTGGGRFQHLL